MELRVNQNGLPILDQFSEEGFIDCVFKITDLEEGEDSYSFNLRASYSGTDVGLRAEVVRGVQGGFDSDMSLVQEHVCRNGVRIFRTGPESDALLSVLAGLYGFGDVALRMVEEETYTGIALHQGEVDMKSDPVKIKIFGKDQDGDSADDYYETFFNLDLKNGFVFWNEKDQEYREPLIRALSVDTPTLHLVDPTSDATGEIKVDLFYCDYQKGENVPGSDAIPSTMSNVLHKMKEVLRSPENFLGIVNERDQTLQFAVENDYRVLIDVPVFTAGKFTHCLQDTRTLEECISLVASLDPDHDYYTLLPQTDGPKMEKKSWWKFW